MSILIDHRPVLVVGAGPTGMTAAMELSRLGIPVRIVDRATGPSTASRALAVQPRTLELLEPRGIGERIARLGNPALATAVYGHGRRLTAMPLERVPSRHHHLVLSQTEIERLLREQLARQDVPVEWGAELVALRQLPGGGVHAVLRRADGRQAEIDASYLIGADGAHSTARHALGLPLAGRVLPQGYVLGDVTLDGPLPGHELAVFLSPDGFVTLFPMGGHRFRCVATEPRRRDLVAALDTGETAGGDALAASDDPPTLEELQQVFDRVAGVPGRLRELDWSFRFRTSSRSLATLRAGSVFLGGDAAYPHGPASGQGMNTGIQDMINLSWKLAMVLRGRADPTLLDTYQTDRLPVLASLVRAAERATGAFGAEESLGPRILARVLPLVLGSELVERRESRVISEIGVTYRGSPLAAPTGPGPGALGALRPGDRVPDLEFRVPAPVRGGASAAVSRLYQLLDLARPTLLAVEPDDGGPPDGGPPDGGQPDSGAAALGVAAWEPRPPAAWQRAMRPWHEVVTCHRVAPAAGATDGSAADPELVGLLRSGGGLLLVRPDGYLGVAAPLADPSALTCWLTRWFVSTAGAAAR